VRVFERVPPTASIHTYSAWIFEGGWGIEEYLWAMLNLVVVLGCGEVACVSLVKVKGMSGTYGALRAATPVFGVRMPIVIGVRPPNASADEAKRAKERAR